MPAGIFCSASHTRLWNAEPVRATGVSNTCRVPAKYSRELALDLREVAVLAGQGACAQPLLQHRERALEPAAVDEVEQMQPAVVGEREHGTERRFEPFGVQHADIGRARGRGTDEAGEGFAKAAAGFEALFELRVDHGFSLSDVE